MFIAVCRKGCQNGGKCVSKNKCSCPQGFRGRRCHKGMYTKTDCNYRKLLHADEK